jgi:hypothetical protein
MRGYEPGELALAASPSARCGHSGGTVTYCGGSKAGLANALREPLLRRQGTVKRERCCSIERAVGRRRRPDRWLGLTRVVSV